MVTDQLDTCSSLLAVATGTNAGSCLVSNYSVLISPVPKEARVEEGLTDLSHLDLRQSSAGL